MFGCGFVGPNSVALALQRYPQAAGAASAVLGSFQFAVAALVAPLAGIGGTADALPMALLITVLPFAALGSRFALAGIGRGQARAVGPTASGVGGGRTPVTRDLRHGWSQRSVGVEFPASSSEAPLQTGCGSPPASLPIASIASDEHGGCPDDRVRSRRSGWDGHRARCSARPVSLPSPDRQGRVSTPS